MLKNNIIVGNRVKLVDNICGEIITVSEDRVGDSAIFVRIDQWFLSEGAEDEIKKIYQKDIQRIFVARKNAPISTASEKKTLFNRVYDFCSISNRYAKK